MQQAIECYTELPKEEMDTLYRLLYKILGRLDECREN